MSETNITLNAIRELMEDELTKEDIEALEEMEEEMKSGKAKRLA